MFCPFCNPPATKIILANELAYALYDKYPVSPAHTLIIPKRHVASLFDTTHEERQSINEILEQCKMMLDRDYAPNGYNIGVNIGESAGQTIYHVHVHLIPRYIGDIENPRGGVRGVIPTKRLY